LKWNWFRQSNAIWDFEIFDKASLGPWGAVMLLFRTKGRSLAALGAILIILLLAIDTFFQQVITMPTRDKLDNRLSMFPVLPRTVKYTPGFLKVYRDDVAMNVPDSEMQLVVEKFAFGNGNQPVPFGNGTRPDIPLVRTYAADL
jgi:drug/metabolite transporter superfamily protein YnfA